MPAGLLETLKITMRTGTYRLDSNFYSDRTPHKVVKYHVTNPSDMDAGDFYMVPRAVWHDVVERVPTRAYDEVMDKYTKWDDAEFEFDGWDQFIIYISNDARDGLMPLPTMEM
jgi:hypothetical protein